MLDHYLKFRLHDRLGWVSIFQTGQDTKCLAGLWLGFGKFEPTQGHTAVAICRPFGSGRDNFIGIRAVGFLKFLSHFQIPVDIGYSSVLV